jgi:hypothetical protein
MEFRLPDPEDAYSHTTPSHVEEWFFAKFPKSKDDIDNSLLMYRSLHVYIYSLPII